MYKLSGNIGDSYINYHWTEKQWALYKKLIEQACKSQAYPLDNDHNFWFKCARRIGNEARS